MECTREFMMGKSEQMKRCCWPISKAESSGEKWKKQCRVMDNFSSLFLKESFYWFRSECSCPTCCIQMFLFSISPMKQDQNVDKQSCLNCQTAKFVNRKKTKRDIKEAERECFTFFPFLYMAVDKNAPKLSHVILYHEGWTEMLWKFILDISQSPSALALGGL